MRQGTKREIRKAPALSLRSRLVLGTALATSAFLGGYRGYVRRAFAACVGEGGTYICSDETDHDADAHRRAADGDDGQCGDIPGFSIDTRVDNEGTGGDAFTLTGTGGLTFTDNINSLIAGQSAGIAARNNGSGALSITTTGTVVGTATSSRRSGEVIGGQGITAMQLRRQYQSNDQRSGCDWC